MFRLILISKPKVCFLCLKTRFSIFGQWGVQCKLCQKTVCAKCYTKVSEEVSYCS